MPIATCLFNATNGLTGHLEDYLGRWVVLYFYPKDATPGCTLESQDFRDHHQAFVALNTTIFGISRDNLTSHNKFKAQQNLPFELISDTDEALCQQFGVIKMRSMYGKDVRGIERSTFIIDPQGNIRQEWRKVTVKEHVEEVLHSLKTLIG